MQGNWKLKHILSTAYLFIVYSIIKQTKERKREENYKLLG